MRETDFGKLLQRAHKIAIDIVAHTVKLKTNLLLLGFGCKRFGCKCFGKQGGGGKDAGGRL